MDNQDIYEAYEQNSSAVNNASTKSDHVNIADFSSRGMFGPEGLLAALESTQRNVTSKKLKLTSDPDDLENSKIPSDDTVTGDVDVDSTTNSSVHRLGDGQGAAENTIKNTNSSRPRPSHEAAFAIDHIMETILRNMDRNTLFNSRLVCGRWAFFASKELQKIVTLTFGLPNWRRGEESGSNQDFHLVRHARYKLQDLIILMNSSNFANSPFPCTSFAFRDADAIYPAAQHFLNVHGAHLKKLELIRFFFRRSPPPIYFKDLRRLLLTQAPNLEHLILRVNVEFQGEYGGENEDESESNSSTSSSYGSEMETDDLENNRSNNEISFFQDSQNTINATLQLKVLEMYSKCPQNIFQEMLAISPKLVRVDMNRSENIDCFVRPINRLGLLKKLVISVNKETIESLEILANHETEQGDFQIRELTVTGDFLAFHPLLWSRGAKVINTILKKCSTSCEILVWHPMRFLPWLQMPEMSRVKKLVLDFHYYSPRIPDFPTQFFPLGMRLGGSFPDLKCVVFENSEGGSGGGGGSGSGRGCSETFTHLFDITHETLPSVTSVTLGWGWELNLRDSVREMFPNAKIY